MDPGRIQFLIGGWRDSELQGLSCSARGYWLLWSAGLAGGGERGAGSGEILLLYRDSLTDIHTHTLFTSFTHSFPQKQSTRTISLPKGTPPPQARRGPCQKWEEIEALLFPTEGSAHQGPGLSLSQWQNYPTLSAS